MADHPTIDWDALAAQAGASPYSPPDWEALAKAAGAESVTESAPKNKPTDWDRLAQESGAELVTPANAYLPGVPEPGLPAGLRPTTRPALTPAQKRTVSLGGPKPEDKDAFAKENAALLDINAPIISGPLSITALLPQKPTTVSGGIAKGAAELAEGLTQPSNLLMFGLGPVIGAAGKIIPFLPRAISAAFTLQMGNQVLGQAPKVTEAIKDGDYPKAAEEFTKAVGAGYFAQKAGEHALGGPSLLDAHNAEAARLLEEERAKPSYFPAPSEFVLGAEAQPVTVNGENLEIRPQGVSSTGRPSYQVVDPSTGKVRFAGFGGPVQDWLRTNGGESVAPPPAETAVAATAASPVAEAPIQAAAAEDLKSSAPAPEEEPAEPELPQVDTGHTMDLPSGKYTVTGKAKGVVQFTQQKPDGTTIARSLPEDLYRHMALGAQPQAAEVPPVPVTPPVPQAAVATPQPPQEQPQEPEQAAIAPVEAPAPPSAPEEPPPPPAGVTFAEPQKAPEAALEAPRPEEPTAAIEPIKEPAVPEVATPEPVAATPAKPTEPAVATHEAPATSEYGDIRKFWDTLKVGDTINTQHGPIELTKVGAFNMQPIMPVGGKWGAFGPGTREVTDIEAKLPDGSTKQFSTVGLHDYVTGKQAPVAAPVIPPAATTEKLAVTGNTYPVRNALRKLGATWDADNKAWVIPNDQKLVGNVKALGKGINVAPLGGKVSQNVATTPEVAPQAPKQYQEGDDIYKFASSLVPGEQVKLGDGKLRKVDFVKQNPLAVSLRDPQGGVNTYSAPDLRSVLIEGEKKPVTPQIVPAKPPTPLATPAGPSTIEASNEPAGQPEAKQPVRAEDRGALAGELPAASAGTPESGTTPIGSGTSGGSGQPSERTGAGQGPQLEPSGGTVSGVVGNPAEPERTFPPRAQDVVSTHHDRDYRIPDGRVVSGSPESRAKNNIEAIRTLREIQQQDRPATVQEQGILAQYVGWGAVPQLFAQKPGFEQFYNDLKSLLTEEEFAEAQRSTTNAHYTSDAIVDAMWKAVQGFGAKPGMSWLEPAVGVGNFFGRQPQELLEGARRVGLDKDSLSAQIAKLLYPDSGIDHVAFEEAELPSEYFDGAVSNIPFGNFGVHDPAFRGKTFLTNPIHNYFFAKSLSSVRPGGVVAFVTSRYTMDNIGPAAINFRRWVGDKAHLIGAVRLPTGAFRQSSGTDVITDLIFLRKRLHGETTQGEEWLKAPRKMVPGAYGQVPIETNEYFQKHPEMVLGKEGTGRGQFSADDYDVKGVVTPEQINQAISRFSKVGFEDWKPEQRKRTVATREIKGAEGSKLGGLFFDDKGSLFRRTSKGAADPVEVSAPMRQRIKGQLVVRDALAQLLDAELADKSDGTLAHLRKNLNATYDSFVKANGPLSSQANTSVMKGDPDAPLLVSLERRFSKGNKAKGIAPTTEKAPIFSRRMLRPAQVPTSVGEPKEALYISLNEKGRIDFDRMGELTGKTPEQLQQDLAGLIYQDPQTKIWQTAEEYLSGSVRNKLKQAQAVAKLEPQYMANAEALEKVQPEDIPPGQIRALMGVTWVPLDVYSQFATEMLGASRPVQVKYVGGNWFVDAGYGNRLNNGPKWNTARVGAVELLNDSLNMKRTKVVDRDSDGSTHVNPDETKAARARQMEMQDHFEKWLFEDTKRGDQLVRIYNDTQNDLRLRTYDGSHLTLPGMARDAAVVRSGDLDPHQKAGIWRQIVQPNVLLAHVVGGGKTFSAIAGGMELKRLGLIRRPMYVVPNATLSSWQDQFAALYPQARVLVFSEKDLVKENRKRIMAQIATGDWDATVVPHSSFQFLATGEDIFNQHYDKLSHELEEQIREAQEAGMDTRMVKRMEKSKERLLTSLKDKRKADTKDQTVTWEQLGIDQLFVDESDSYKKLGFATKQGNVAGIDQNGNQKTFDLLMKLRHTQTHGRGAVFMTGTPVTNTMGELYSIMKYLIEPELEARGIGKFDEWAANFGRTVDVFEPKIEGGGYQMKARFAQFVNLPELATLFRSFADVVTSDMIDIPRPSIAGGERQGIVTQLNDEQLDYLEKLRARAEGIRRDPRGSLPDNMLAIYGDNAKMAMDVRMVRPSAAADPAGRLASAANKIHELWEDSKSVKGTQLVVSDLGKPAEAGGSKEFSAYDDLINKLIERGIPRNEIAHIYQAKNKAQRAKIFQDVNDGKIRVLLGSTQKMGVGVNVQRRLYALHHLDIPHRPSDLEQREGRILRQGNENPEVHIYYYTTQGSLDEAKLANVIRKAKFINQMMQGKSGVREAEDVGGMIPSLQMYQAMTSGDPRVMQKMENDAEVDRLGGVYSGWKNQQYKIRAELQQIPGRIQYAQKSIENIERDKAIRDAAGDTWTIGKKKFEGEKIGKDVSDSLRKEFAKVADNKGTDVEVGAAFGMPILASANGPILKVEIGDTASIILTPEELPVADLYRRIKNRVESFEEDIAAKKQIIDRANKERANLEGSIQEVWPYADKFRGLVETQQRLIKELGADKGDDAAIAAGDGAEIADKSVEAQESDSDEEEAPEDEEESAEPEKPEPKETIPATARAQGLQPLAEVRTPQIRSAWGGNGAESGDIITDGHIAVLRSAIKDPSKLVALSAKAKDKTYSESAVKKFYDPAVESATKPLTEMGWKKIGENKNLFYFDADRKVYSVDPDLVKLVQSVTGANEVRGSEPGKPLVFYAGGEPVALIAPTRPSTSDIPEAPIGIQAEGSRPGEQLANEAPGFFSQLERTIESKMPEKAHPGQIQGILRNPQNGVKPDEVKWSGIMEWLGQQGGSVTKKQVLDFVRANEVKLTEVRKEDKPETPSWTSVPGMATKYSRYVTPGGHNYREVLLALPVDQNEAHAAKSGRIKELIEQRDALKQEIGDLPFQALRNDLDSLDGQIRKISHWPSAPAAAKDPKDQALLDELGNQWGKVTAQIDRRTDLERQHFNTVAQIDLAMREDPAKRVGFKSSHWDEPNILAHVRLDDRTGPNGEKILHVNEIQSDWAQTGRKKGFQEKAEPLNTAERVDLMHLLGDEDFLGFEGSGAAMKAIREHPDWAKRWDVQSPKLIELGNRYRNATVTGQVPAMPFPKTWHELAFKRILREAAERGYDAVTWDTGETQAARYDLSKHLDTLQWDHNPDGSYDVTGRKDGQKVVAKERITSNELENFVGKEMAQKILDKVGVDSKNPNMGKISGLDLKVGGEGMKGFYDKILPDFANRIGKKWGAKVTESTLAGKPPHVSVEYINGVDDEDGYIVSEAGEGPISKPFATEKEADEFVERQREQVHVHKLPITEAMRESVMQGQPLFYKPTPLPEVPKLNEATRGRAYVNNAPAEYHAANTEMKRIPLPDEYRGKAMAYSINPSGMELLGRAAGKTQDETGRGYVGLHFSPADTGRLARLMRVMTRGEAPQLIHALESANELGNSAIFISDHPQWEKYHNTALAEELHHAVQAQVSGRTRTHFGKSLGKFTSNPLYEKAASTLSERYTGEQRGGPIEAIEVGVRLMRPNGYKELGLTAEEARSLAANYVRTLRNEYGKQRPAEVAAHVFDALRRTEQVGEEHGTRAPSAGRERGTRTPEVSGQSVSGYRPGEELTGAGKLQPETEERREPTHGVIYGSGLGGLQEAYEKYVEPKLKELGEAAKHSFSPDGPRDTYSGKSALASLILPGRGLAQLEEASPEAHTAMMKAAAYSARVSVALRVGISKMDAELKGTGIGHQDLFRAYQQSRLNSLRDMWDELAAKAQKSTDDQLKADYSAETANFLHAIENKEGMPQDAALTATTLLETENYDLLRQFLSNTFTDAGDSVHNVLEPKEYDALKDRIKTDPPVAKANETYKKIVETPMRTDHLSNDGILSDRLGDLNTYFPLIAVGHEAGTKVSRVIPFRKPRNPFNKMATGMASQGYSVDTPELKDRLMSGFSANSRAAALDALYESGVLTKSPMGNKPETVIFNGMEFPAALVPVAPPRMMVTNGKVAHIPVQWAYGPKPLVDELRPLFESAQATPQNILRTAINGWNKFSLTGPALAVIDSANIFGVLVSNTPYLGKTLAEKGLSLPLVKRFGALLAAGRTDPLTDEASQDLLAMADVAALPEKTMSVTWSKRLADVTGAKLAPWYDFSPLLYGPKGLDIRARLRLWRIAKAAWPDATPQELHHYVNRIGNYTSAMQGTWERSLKKSGISPFYTRGTTMLMNGLDALTGRSGMGGGDPLGKRLTSRALLMGAGAAMFVAVWALLHEATTGKLPWNDKRSRLGYLIAPDSFRKTSLGRKLTGTKPGVVYIPLYWGNPIAFRGLRLAGIPAAYDAWVEGGKGWQVAERAATQAIDAATSPLVGPAARAPWVLYSGTETTVTDDRDREGHLALQFYPAIDPKSKGWESFAMRAGAAALSSNAFLNDYGQASGFLGPERRNEGNMWLKMSLSAAGLPEPTVSNPYAKSEILRSQRTGTR